MSHSPTKPAVRHALIVVAAAFGLLPVTRASAQGAVENGGASGRGATDHPEPANGSDISDALGDLALQANPGIGATETRIRALEQQVERSGAWMDPTFAAEYSNMPIDAPVPGKHPMSGLQLTLKQTFYWPGKLDAREEEARSLVRQERLTLAEKKVALRATVKRTYYRLALTRQLRSVTRQHIEVVGNLIDVVRVKNEAGIAPQHELLRLRVLSDQLKDDIGNFDRDEQALTAAINAALHRALEVPVPTPEQLVVAAPVEDAAALARRAERQRPLLGRLSAQAETYGAAARRAARDGYPDLTVWAGYRIRTQAGTDPGTDFVSLGVSLPLPLFYDRRSGSEERQNEAMSEAATEDRAAELDGIRGELGRLIASWRRSVDQARAYREQLTPEARIALDAVYASYQVGRADFETLFQAQLQLLNFERTTLAAEAGAAQARVDTEGIVGSGVK